MFRNLIGSFFGLLLIALIISPAHSSGAKPLSGCFVRWVPYTNMINDRAEGISVDLLREAAKRANYDLNLRELPWKRCLVLVQRAEIDFAFDAVDRPGFIHGKHPNALYIQAFWMRKSDDFGPYEYIGKLTDKRLGLFQGFQYSDEILNAGFGVVEWVQTESIAAEMLSRGRLDLVFADAVVMQNIIQRDNHSLKPMLPVFNVQALYPTFNVSKVAKRDAIDVALGEMHKDGTVDKIYIKHTGATFSEFAEMGGKFTE